MARGIFKIITAALAVSVAAGAAHAAGFSRGSADTDLIYEDGNFNIRAGATIVSPSRKFTKALAPLGGSLVGTDYADTYVIPSAAIKLNATDDMRCVGSVSQPYGGSTTYAVPYGTSAKLHESFASTEAGLTCGYKIDLSKGQFWVLGGLFNETFNYDLTAVGGAIKVNLGASDWGYRVGAAYAIPEIALRAELMYRAGTHYDATGTTTRLAATGTGLDAFAAARSCSACRQRQRNSSAKRRAEASVRHSSGLAGIRQCEVDGLVGHQVAGSLSCTRRAQAEPV